MSSADEICPDRYAHGQTHRLVFRRADNYRPAWGGPKEPLYVQTCQYCGATERNGVMMPPMMSSKRVR